MNGGALALESPARSRAGSGRVAFTRVGDRTVISEARATSPLRLLTPRNHGDAAWVYLSTLGGGAVDADHYALELHVSRQARAFVSTQGATRAYRSPRGATSELHAEVSDDALLVYAPDPLSLFRGARFEQRNSLHLSASASSVFVDVVTCGRTAMGERWSFDRFRSQLQIIQDGVVVADEQLQLDPNEGPISDRMRRFEAFATVVLTGPLLAEHAERAGRHVAGLAPQKRSTLIQSASPVGGGYWFRFAADRVERLTHSIRELLSFLPSLLGDDPFARRF